MAIALAIAVPSSALAETRYVAKGGSDTTACTGAGVPCLTVTYAVGQAVDGDTIDIGPGTYAESINTPKILTFVGRGGGSIGGAPGTTTVRGPDGVKADGAAAFVLPNGGTLRTLRAQGGNGGSEVLTFGHGGGDGVRYDSNSAAASTLRLEAVVVLGGNGGSGTGNDPFERGTAGTGIDVRSDPGPVRLSAADSEFAAGTGLGNGIAVWVDGPTAAADITDSVVPDVEYYGPAMAIFDGAQVQLEATDLYEDIAFFHGSLSISRSRLSADGVPFYLDASETDTAQAEIRNSLIVSRQTHAIEVSTAEEASVLVTIHGSTVIGHGEAAVVAEREDEALRPPAVVLQNSIARHLPPAGLPIPPADLLAIGGTISADFSSFTTAVSENGGTVTAPGSGGNVAGDPLLVDEANGVYVPSGVSPLIDRGDPSIVQVGELDLVGAPRSLDGNLDCLIAPDIGAYELTGRSAPCPPADAAPVVSRFGITNRVFAPKGKRPRRAAASARRGKKLKRGTKFTYTLSEPARVSITIERKTKRRKKVRWVKQTILRASEKAGRQSTAFNGRAKGRALKAGRYRARIVATDQAGQASNPRQVAFRVVRG